MNMTNNTQHALELDLDVVESDQTGFEPLTMDQLDLIGGGEAVVLTH